MEQSNSFFSLSIDPVTKANLSETARWARFLAIVGMIMLILAAIAVIFGIAFLAGMGGATGMDTTSPISFSGAFGVGLAVFYIIILLIWFFPLLYLLRFANRMRFALARNDQQALNTSFQNLKICFRFVGIVTIIILILYAVIIALTVVGASVFSGMS